MVDTFLSCLCKACNKSRDDSWPATTKSQFSSQRQPTNDLCLDRRQKMWRSCIILSFLSSCHSFIYPSNIWKNKSFIPPKKTNVQIHWTLLHYYHDEKVKLANLEKILPWDCQILFWWRTLIRNLQCYIPIILQGEFFSRVWYRPFQHSSVTTKTYLSANTRTNWENKLKLSPEFYEARLVSFNIHNTIFH